MKKKVINKVMEFLPIILIVVLLATLVYCIYYIGKLEDQIWERDKTIQDLSFRSDLVEEYFDIKHDSVEHTTSYSLKSSKANYTILQHDSTELVFHQGDKVLSAQELVNEYNALSKDYNKLVRDYNKLVNDYNKLTKEFNDEFNKNMRQIQELESVLGLIEKRYNIQYNIERDSTFSDIVLSNTGKIDSALVLLPYYKDKLKKVSDSVWTIEYYERKK